MNEPELNKFYKEQVVPALKQALKLENIHEIPCIEKVVLNSSVGAADAKTQIQKLEEDLSRISGQKPLVIKAKKSISNFKLREGMPIGVKVTLRGSRMYDFLLRLIAIALPGIRDFRGLDNRFDGKGNVTIGIEDHTIFPEVSTDVSSTQRYGLDITIVTTASDDYHGFELLKLLGFPFRRKVTEAQK